jgi:hypothetical protein
MVLIRWQPRAVRHLAKIYPALPYDTTNQPARRHQRSQMPGMWHGENRPRTSRRWLGQSTLSGQYLPLSLSDLRLQDSFSSFGSG